MHASGSVPLRASHAKQGERRRFFDDPPTLPEIETFRELDYNFSYYSTGVTAPGAWGGGSGVTLHWKGPEKKDPTCCLRSIGISRSRKSQ
jgi:hypothetical protein